MFAIVVASFILGFFFLARFNVLAALVGAVICALCSFIYDVSRDVAFIYALLAGVVAAAVSQAGYIAAQFLRRVRK